MKTKAFSFVMLGLIFLLSAYRANISRNNDGSLTVTTSITQQELQEAVSSAIADPLVKDITVSLESGYVLVSGERQRLNDASKTNTLAFRLDLGVSNGQLTSTISNATLDGKPLEQARVDNWNQRSLIVLQRLGRKTKTVRFNPSA